MAMRVADMSVDELKTVIRETVAQALTELLHDTDEGLQLREEFEKALQLSLESIKSGEKMIAADAVATRLGLDW